MKTKFALKLKAALFVSTRSVAIPGMLLVGMTTLIATTHPVHADETKTGTKTGSWGVSFADGWSTFGWSGIPRERHQWRPFVVGHRHDFHRSGRMVQLHLDSRWWQLDS
jgi:hypothetical protein